MSLHPAPQPGPANPPAWRLCRSSFTVPTGETLAWAKHASRLIHVLARAEAEAKGFDDALLLNEAGEVVETTSANLFWIEAGTVCTPPLSTGALAGVTRAAVLELCATQGIRWAERSISVEALTRTDAVFLTQTVWEVVPAQSIDGVRLSPSPAVDQLRAAYRGLTRAETV
jgi:branched-subunit amino acid aminotransferase/4-amino-4-deoxychorismate lyase